MKKYLISPSALVILVWFIWAVSSVEIADKYLDIPNPSRIYEHLAYYTSMPHIAGMTLLIKMQYFILPQDIAFFACFMLRLNCKNLGTAEDFETAHYTLQKFKEYGLEAWIEEEEVLLNYPNTKASLKIVEPPNLR